MSSPFARIVGIAAMLRRVDAVDAVAPVVAVVPVDPIMAVDPVEAQPDRRARHLHREREGVDGHRAVDVLGVDVTLADRQRTGGLLGRGDEPGRVGRPKRLAQSRPLDQLGRGEVVGPESLAAPPQPVIT